MIPSLTRDELELLVSDELHRQLTMRDPWFADRLRHAPLDVIGSLGPNDRELTDCLEQFAADRPADDPSARIASQLCVKLDSARGAARRP